MGIVLDILISLAYVVGISAGGMRAAENGYLPLFGMAVVNSLVVGFYVGLRTYKRVVGN